MNTIYKYPIEIVDKQRIKLPMAARILTVQIQKRDGKPYIWCLVNDLYKTETHTIRIIGTGNEIEPAFDAHYIGTIQQGPFVWHVFDMWKE